MSSKAFYVSSGVRWYLDLPHGNFAELEKAVEPLKKNDIIFCLPGESFPLEHHQDATCVFVFNPAPDFQDLFSHIRDDGSFCFARKEFIPALRAQGITAFSLPNDGNDLVEKTGEILGQRPKNTIYASAGVLWYLGFSDESWILPLSPEREMEEDAIVLCLHAEKEILNSVPAENLLLIYAPEKPLPVGELPAGLGKHICLAEKAFVPFLRAAGLTAFPIPEDLPKTADLAQKIFSQGLKPIELDNLPECPGRSLSILLLMDSIGCGGMENVLLGLASFLKEKGECPIIGYMREMNPIMQKAFEEKGIPCSRLPGDPAAQIDFCRKNAIDLINGHYTLEFTEAAERLNIPYLQTVHNMYLWNDEEDLTYWRYKYTLMDAFLCVSPLSAQVLAERYWVPPDKVRIIRNGIPPLVHPPLSKKEARKRLKIDSDIFYFITVASLGSIKKQDVLIQAFKQAFPEDEKCGLLLVGELTDSPYQKRLQDLVRLHGLEAKVLFTGQQADVPLWLSAADSFVLPSALEGWSLAVDEARAANLPIIATRAGGAAEQLDSPHDVLLPAYWEEECDFMNCSYASIVENEERDSKICASLAAAMRKHYESAKELTVKRNPPIPSRQVYQRHQALMHLLCLQKRLGLSSLPSPLDPEE